MKSYIKGVITGVLISASVFAAPAIADVMDAAFNTVRININGTDEIQWEENIELADGSKTPSSIIYNNTTYLPMRKISELLGKHIYWNDDSRTVYVTDYRNYGAGTKQLIKHPDADGHVWEYYTFETEDGAHYLGVSDKERGFERVYQMQNDSVFVSDESVFFVKRQYTGIPETETSRGRTSEYNVTKIDFNCGENSQDGEKVFALTSNPNYVFDGRYLFFCGTTPGNYPYEFIGMYDCLTGNKSLSEQVKNHSYYNIKLVESGSGKATLQFCDSTRTGPIFMSRISFDKNTGEFGETVTESDYSDKDFLFYIDGEGIITARDLSGKTYRYEETGVVNCENIRVIQSDAEKAVIEFTNNSNYNQNKLWEVEFDKSAKTFGSRHKKE